jgi:hypothetical protein
MGDAWAENKPSEKGAAISSENRQQRIRYSPGSKGFVTQVS